jgi:hypothetical protein
MKLLNPSPGEILDRLAILELKIKAGDKIGQDITHFVAEKSSLQEAFNTWTGWLKADHPPQAKWDEIAEKRNALEAMNAMLWEAEDLVRVLPEEEMAKLAQLAKRMCRLKDVRADLVRRLGTLYGAADVQEKIYGTSLRSRPQVVR